MMYYIAQRLFLLPFLMLVYSFVIFAIIQVKMKDINASATVSTSCSPISSAFGR